MDFQGAIRLLNASLDSVWQNLATALKVSLLPLLLLALIVGALFFNEIRAIGFGAEEGHKFQVAPFKIFLVFGSAIFLFYFSVVNWHRAILPTHSKDAIPFLETLAYLLKSVLAVLMLAVPLFLVCSIPLSMLGGGRIIVGGFAYGYQQGWGHFALTFFATWLFWLAYIAVSPSLVHSALGGKEGVIAPLWRSEEKGPLMRAAVMIITLCLLADSLVGMGLTALPSLVQLAVHMVLLWFVFMVSISLLTQFYALSETPMEKGKSA